MNKRYVRFFEDENEELEEGLKDLSKKVAANMKTIANRFKSSEVDKLDKALANQVKINKKLSSKENKTEADKKALKAGKAKSSQLRKQIAAAIKKSNDEYEKRKKAEK